MKAEPTSQRTTPGHEPRRMLWLSLGLLLIGLHLVIGPKISLSQWRVERQGNTALEEAIQWKKGTMTLSRDYDEIANIDGKRYNVVGYAFVLISLLGTTLSSMLLGAPPDQFHPLLYVAFVVLPLPLISFWAFREVTGSSPWSAVLTSYLIAGTSLTPVLAVCQDGSLYYINHLLAVSGLMLIGGDIFGRRRMWPAAIGLCLACWSRQMTCLYAIPLLCTAFVGKRSANNSPVESNRPLDDRSLNYRHVTLACLGVLLAGGMPMTLNALKFGNPLNTGYEYIYEGRTDAIGTRAHEALWSAHYASMHLPSLTYAYPSPDIRKGQLYLDTTNSEGASIWLTSPLLLGIFFTARTWWKDAIRRWLMLSSFAVMAGLMFYHTTGAQLAGYYRYSLDYIPLWLLVIAPYLLTPRGKALTVACLAYSALYFNTLR